MFTVQWVFIRYLCVLLGGTRVLIRVFHVSPGRLPVFLRPNPWISVDGGNAGCRAPQSSRGSLPLSVFLLLCWQGVCWHKHRVNGALLSINPLLMSHPPPLLFWCLEHNFSEAHSSRSWWGWLWVSREQILYPMDSSEMYHWIHGPNIMIFTSNMTVFQPTRSTSR